MAKLTYGIELLLGTYNYKARRFLVWSGALIYYSHFSYSLR